jgi:hypothetical protein
MREEFELMGQDFSNRDKHLDEMTPALRALWRGGWVSWSGRYYRVPEVMIEPHPTAPVPILCGGESPAALRRAARLSDGRVGSAYTWEEAESYVCQLNTLRGEYGRGDEPFEIMLGLREPASPDVYGGPRHRRHRGDVQPWAGSDAVLSGDHDSFKLAAEGYRNPSSGSPAPSSSFVEGFIDPAVRRKRPRESGRS